MSVDVQRVALVIATAPTTSQSHVQQLTNGETEAILTFSTRKAAGEVASHLKDAGATVHSITRTPYKEFILTARWA